MRSCQVLVLIILLARSAFSQGTLQDTTRRLAPIPLPELRARLDSVRSALPWRYEFESSLGVTQTFATHNWTGGQSNSVVWVADVRGRADKALSRRWTFDNDLRLQFGQSHSYDMTTQKWFPPQKAADRIRFDAILRRFGHIIDPYVAGSAESQFVDQSGRLDRYFNPAEFTESAGIAHYWLNNPGVRVLRMRSGLGIRERLFFHDDTLNTSKTYFEAVTDAGAEWVTDVELGSPFTKYGYISKLIMFQALYNSRARESDHRWKTVDINWDNTFRANITRILQVSLSWQIVFDEEVSRSGRFRESLTLAVGYRFAKR